LASGKLHIFTAIYAEADAIRPILPAWAELTVIGIRAVKLERTIEPRAIVMAGFAGALDPALELGDIVRDDPQGTIFTSSELVATAEEKARLFHQTGAKAVDMENATVREFALRMGVPFFGIRAISDTAGEAVDPMVLRFVDEMGGIRPAAVAKGLLLKPSLIPTLNRLRINSGIAGRALAQAVKTFLEENRGLFE
jgi:adenosylhomocysteine nucleosidase